MRRALGFCAALLAWTGAAAAQAQEQSPATIVVAFDRDSVTPLIVEGEADRATGRLAGANDPVRVASISKLLVALAALRLMEEGSLDLDRDVSEYLGWHLRAPGFPDDPVTLRHLLSHRSGLRDDAGYIIPLGENLQAHLADPAAWYPHAPPGEAPFAYANLGSPVVATVMEAATGERFDALMERTVFAPLGISACFNWIGCTVEQEARAIVLYRDTGEVARDDAQSLPPNCTIPVADGVACSLQGYVPGTNASVFSPQGGLRISLTDLARIGQMLAIGGEGFLGEESMAYLLASSEAQIAGQEFFCGYGLGLQLIEAPGRGCVDQLFADGAVRLGHPGEAYGLRSGLWFDPLTGEGIVYAITAVPPRAGAEDEGGFDPREIALIARAQAMQD